MTTCKCVHLVTSSYLQSRNIDNNNNLRLIMVTTNCSTLHTVYSIRPSATQGSNDKTHRVSRRTAATTRFSPKKGCQKQTAPSYLPTIRSDGPLPHFTAQMYYGHGVIGDGIFTLWRFGFVLAHGFPLQECWMVMNLFCSR